MSFNFKQLTGSKKFRSWNDWNPGDSVVGTVELIEKDSLNKNYQNMTVKVSDFDFKQNNISLNVDERLHLNPCASLQKGIEAGAKIGKVVKIVYLGKEENKTGDFKGKLSHRVEVYVADGETIDTSALDDSGL
jgi:hypothetical protein